MAAALETAMTVTDPLTGEAYTARTERQLHRLWLWLRLRQPTEPPVPPLPKPRPTVTPAAA